MIAVWVIVVHVAFSEESLVCKEIGMLVNIMVVAEYSTVSGAE